jgi:multiple sugar transport system substrate-binding protein
VFGADVIWTAEFATQKWLYDLTPYIDQRRSEFMAAPLETATQLMVDVVKNGGAPRAVTTYMEPEPLQQWQTGNYAFMRNWPYAFALSQKTGELKGKFAVAPLPEFEGAGKVGVLGGANAVISAFSKNPGAALQLVDYISSPGHQRIIASEYSLAPTLSATYDDPAVKKALPFSVELKQAVAQARARPVSPVYPQISQAIDDNVNAALSGQPSAEDAMKQAQADIEKALATF